MQKFGYYLFITLQFTGWYSQNFHDTFFFKMIIFLNTSKATKCLGQYNENFNSLRHSMVAFKTNIKIQTVFILICFTWLWN
jgi:hypothetical protein